jgi:hypothetical protein
VQGAGGGSSNAVGFRGPLERDFVLVLSKEEAKERAKVEKERRRMALKIASLDDEELSLDTKIDELKVLVCLLRTGFLLHAMRDALSHTQSARERCWLCRLVAWLLIREHEIDMLMLLCKH